MAPTELADEGGDQDAGGRAGWLRRRVGRPLRRWAPGLHAALQPAWRTAFAAYRRWQAAANGRMLDALARRYVAAHGLLVAEGPFAGLRYPQAAAFGSAFLPKLLGSYELEIHPFVEALIARQPTLVVDIGVAEGYFAVGLASRLPGAMVIGYDIAAEALRLASALADANGVAARVSLRHGPTPAELAELPLAGAAVVCDCEGAEKHLLDPAAVPGLAKAAILVELHDWLDPSITPTLRDRFAATHDWREVWSQPRDPAAWPRLQTLPARRRAAAISEWRYPNLWAWLTPRG